MPGNSCTYTFWMNETYRFWNAIWVRENWRMRRSRRKCRQCSSRCQCSSSSPREARGLARRPMSLSHGTREDEASDQIVRSAWWYTTGQPNKKWNILSIKWNKLQLMLFRLSRLCIENKVFNVIIWRIWLSRLTINVKLEYKRDGANLFLLIQHNDWLVSNNCMEVIHDHLSRWIISFSRLI